MTTGLGHSKSHNRHRIHSSHLCLVTWCIPATVQNKIKLRSLAAAWQQPGNSLATARLSLAGESGVTPIDCHYSNSFYKFCIWSGCFWNGPPTNSWFKYTDQSRGVISNTANHFNCSHFKCRTCKISCYNESLWAWAQTLLLGRVSTESHRYKREVTSCKKKVMVMKKSPTLVLQW